MNVNFNPAVSKLALNNSQQGETTVSIPSQTASYNLTNLSDMRAIAGQSLVNFYGNQGIAPQVSRVLETESTKRIRGEYKWPEIQDIKAFMISAETQTFMKTGGLAEVAVQLPDEFNKKMAAAPGNKLQIVTPLYVGNGAKSASITKIDDTHYLYKGAEKKEIEIEKVSEFPIQFYDKQKQKLTKENVGIFVGNYGGSDYVFLGNDKYFSITPAADNPGACQGPYVKNDQGISELERMLFFSKATYQLMKNGLKTPIKGVETPNVILSNDWHASPLTTFMRDVAPVEKSDRKMDAATYDYLKNTPVIHITHNATYVGKDRDNRSEDIFRMIYGRDANKIPSAVKGYMGDGSPFFNERGQYCAAYSDLMNADRIVAVSPNYAKEISTSKFMSAGQNEIHKIREGYGTMLGIINGYTKTAAEPNEKMISSINSVLNPTRPLKPYAHMYNDAGYEAKMENKAASIDILNELARKAASGEKLNGFTLVQPENCKIETDKDIRDIPFIASVGRITEQKGFDYLAESLKNVLSKLQPGDERPIVGILGSGDPKVIENLSNLKKEIAETDPVAASRMFIFEGFSAPLRDALAVGSDFFLIPSKWEPCGLTQMEAMPKGSIPITTATGGLVDTIVDDQEGFVSDVFYATYRNYATNEVMQEPVPVFDNGKYSVTERPANNIEAFSKTLQRALDTYYTNPEKIKQMSINAMAKDFSWDVPNGPLEEYIKLMRTGSLAA